MVKKQKRDKEFFEGILKEAQEMCCLKAPAIKSSHRKGFVEACGVYHAAWLDQKKSEANLEALTAAAGKSQKRVSAISNFQESWQDKCNTQKSAMKKAIKAAGKILEVLDMDSNEALEEHILKGAVVIQATPEGLAKFSDEDKINGKLIEALLKRPDLMKGMLSSGGPKDGNYGNAMKIYTSIMGELPEKDDEFTLVNKKLAMAVALELATPIVEFDTKIEVNPVERFEHYEKAHRNGELDPAFPNFSTWEMRHIVNCDATNDQLQWARDCLFAYAPYIITVVDPKWRYLYILKSDVLSRNPTWTSSPRTYQQVLSGGGKDAPNAWFGRFICKAFGIPTWGAKQKGSVGLTRWTPTGWEAMLGIDWDSCSSEDMSGHEFKGEVDARSALSTEEYYKKLGLMEWLADIMDSRREPISGEEKGVLSPHRLWKSLAIIQKALMLQPDSTEKFERNEVSIVRTKAEKYLEAFEKDIPGEEMSIDDDGIVTIPGSAFGYHTEAILSIPCATGGRQLNFLADGIVEYETPDEMVSKMYKVTCEVCTVHLKQAPLVFTINDGEEQYLMDIPYTMGEWETTAAIELQLSCGDFLKLKRYKPSFGLAVKKIILEPKS
jgi:hypothetical protein